MSMRKTGSSHTSLWCRSVRIAFHRSGTELSISVETRPVILRCKVRSSLSAKRPADKYAEKISKLVKISRIDMSRRKCNVSYIKPDEPKFLRELKKQIGYKEGPTVDTKREPLPQIPDDDRKELHDGRPVIVVLNPGDLTAEEADAFKKQKEKGFDRIYFIDELKRLKKK